MNDKLYRSTDTVETHQSQNENEDELDDQMDYSVSKKSIESQDFANVNLSSNSAQSHTEVFPLNNINSKQSISSGTQSTQCIHVTYSQTMSSDEELITSSNSQKRQSTIHNNNSSANPNELAKIDESAELVSQNSGERQDFVKRKMDAQQKEYQVEILYENSQLSLGQVKNVNEELQSQVDQLKQLLQEKDDLLAKNVQDTAQVNHLKQQLQEKESELQKTQQQLTRKVKENEIMVEVIQELNLVKGELKIAKETIKNQEQIIETLKADLFIANQPNEDLEKLKNANNQLQICEGDDKKDIDVRNLQAVFLNEKQNLQDVQDQLIKFKESKQKLIAENQSKDKQIDDLRVDKRNLVIKLNEMEKQVTDLTNQLFGGISHQDMSQLKTLKRVCKLIKQEYCKYKKDNPKSVFPNQKGIQRLDQLTSIACELQDDLPTMEVVLNELNFDQKDQIQQQEVIYQQPLNCIGTNSKDQFYTFLNDF